MKDKSVEANIVNENNNMNNINYFLESKLFPNNYNITGINIENKYIKRKTENNNIKIIKNSKNENNEIKGVEETITISPKKDLKKTEFSFYKALPKNEKVKFIQKLIKNSNSEEPLDGLAIKRKRYSLTYLIHQFDVSESSKSFEENNICKRPYPLLYCLSNRQIGNDSSNLLTKILASNNQKLSKGQENFIKKSFYSKIFNMDISDIIKNNFQNQNTLKFFSKNINNNSKSKNSNKKLPFLNKYIKSKVSNYKYKIFDRNNSLAKNTSSGFVSEENQFRLKKNLKRWNSTLYMKINGKIKLIDKDKKDKIFNNNIENFKNKTVCLYNHKNNKKNNIIIK